MANQTPISPWCTETVRLESPDGSTLATVTEPGEIAMGAPTSGELKLSNGQSASNCSPSMVWSEDSTLLAVPQWTDDRMQRLLVIDVARRKRVFAPREYRVLELHAFRGGIVEGIDSPKYQPCKLAIDVRKLLEGV
ncbi:MAG: hypothetical protein IT513_07805 [Burkholderiales bacterium]|nr:hypothetical protein [Burkholderiales bacterium]